MTPEVGLTRLEREVLAMAAAGATRSQIATVLGFTTEQVKDMFTAIRMNLNCETTTEAVAVAMRKGWL